MSALNFARAFPGGHVKANGGFTVDCPACGGSRCFTISQQGNLMCVGAGCPGTFVDGLGMTEETFDDLYTAEFPDAGKAQTGDEEEETAATRVGANDIVEWVLDRYRIGRTTDGLTFAVARESNTAKTAREVKSIRADVLRGYRDERIANGQKGYVLSRDSLTSALDVVEAYAEQEEAVTVAIRSAQVGDDRIVLDLGDADGNVVEITPAGWRVIKATESTPLFRRSEATAALPIPVRGGSMDSLREILGLAADDRRWMLARGWMVGSLFSEVPRPLLWATGPQGSGKSTRARMILSMIEPTEALGKTPGKNERDDAVSARGRYLTSYDNITTISQSTSDWLCRLVTGVSDDRRTMYSDDGLRPVTYRRSGVATSITLPPGLGSDALERATLLAFDRMPDNDRQAESTLWTAYAAAKPEILGAMLDDVVAVLRNLRKVAAEDVSWPRMADYGQVLLALDRGLGLADDAGHFAAYVGGVDDALAERAEDDPFASAVLLMVSRNGGHWRGTSAAGLKLVNDAAREGTFEDLPKWWPGTPGTFATFLMRVSETLRHAGVVFASGKSNGSRWISLTGDPAAAVVVAAPVPFEPPF
jgi:energy-coupling factor transporter ATP-binding protein EcfA2